MNIEAKEMGQANALAGQQQQCGLQAKWATVIEDKVVLAPQRHVKAQVLKDQANVPAEKILVRDLGGEHDVAIADAQVLDLAAGNVFYVVPACEAPKPTGHCASPKLAFVVNDRPEETERANQTGRTLRDWFKLGLEVELFRDYESPHDHSIGLDDAVNFADGCVFYTRHPKPHTINVTIDGKTYEFHQHQVAIQEMKKRAGIKLADVLAKIVDGQLVDQADNAVIEIQCGDVFVSHPRDNASS